MDMARQGNEKIGDAPVHGTPIVSHQDIGLELPELPAATRPGSQPGTIGNGRRDDFHPISVRQVASHFRSAIQGKNSVAVSLFGGALHQLHEATL
jgi:hypothetical protein